jgi:hypothetical protein
MFRYAIIVGTDLHAMGGAHQFTEGGRGRGTCWDARSLGGCPRPRRSAARRGTRACHLSALVSASPEAGVLGALRRVEETERYEQGRRGVGIKRAAGERSGTRRGGHRRLASLRWICSLAASGGICDRGQRGKERALLTAEEDEVVGGERAPAIDPRGPPPWPAGELRARDLLSVMRSISSSPSTRLKMSPPPGATRRRHCSGKEQWGGKRGEGGRCLRWHPSPRYSHVWACPSNSS